LHVDQNKLLKIWFWALFVLFGPLYKKFGDFFSKSSGHPALCL